LFAFGRYVFAGDEKCCFGCLIEAKAHGIDVGGGEALPHPAGLFAHKKAVTVAKWI
jgi:hypothetical protein